MKKIILLLGVFCLAFSCQQKTSDNNSHTSSDSAAVNAVLDSLNMAAARADFKAYFNLYADESVFTGTDATERWNKKAFMDFAKPYFDRGKAWNFSSLKRNIYFDESNKYAWFDELLDTQMKLCRGSGVLVKTKNGWKLKQYILSATVPNDMLDTLVKLKSPYEDPLIKNLKGQP